MSSMSVKSYSTMSGRKGVTGLASGLENTEEIIEKLTSGTTNKITKQLQQRQQAIWKQSFYQEISTKMTDFYNKYFSYTATSSNNILSSKFFNASSISSSSSYVTASGDASAAQNMKIRDIKQLATKATFTSAHKVSNENMTTGQISEIWQYNSIAGSKLVFNIDGKDYTAAIDSNFYFSEAALATDGEDKFTPEAIALQKTELTDALNAAISANENLAGKIGVSFTEDNKLSFESMDGNTFKISAGTGSLLTAIGITPTKTGVGTATLTAGKAMDLSTVAYLKDLEECLAGTLLNVTLNGVTKQIEFKESEKEQFDTVEKLGSYIQASLDKSYGKNNVFVSVADNRLSFSTTKTDTDGSLIGNSSSVFIIGSSSATGIMGKRGVLQVSAGESNRIEYNKTLNELKDSFGTPLVAGEDGKYSLTVNGKTFSYSGDTLLGDIITGISADEDVGVAISYSSVTDTFSVRAKETGSNGQVKIENAGTSNLASVLFGQSGTDYTITPGTDFIANMSFDGGNTYVDVIRSNNSFTIDDVTLEFKGMAEGSVVENISFSADNNISDLYDKIKEFVDDYNNIMDWMNTKVNEPLYGRTSADDTDVYLPLTDEQKKDMSEDEIKEWETKAKTGLLRNDNTLYQISINLRRAVNDIIGDTGLGLFQIGITTSSKYSDGGKLVIDEEKLKTALTTNMDNVKKIFTQQDVGMAYRLQNVLKDAAIGTSEQEGLLVQIAGKAGGTSSTSMLSKRIEYMTQRLNNLKSMLKQEEDRWWAKFTSLETYISNMNSQSEWLSQYSSGS